MNLRELAKLAKLSTAAVSLALHDSPKISANTKKRVRNLAKQVGYKPDPRLVALMKHLRKPKAVSQPACLGVISFYDQLRPWESSVHLTKIYQSMTSRANDRGYRLEPLWLQAPGMSFRRFRDILHTRGIEGLLCFGSPHLDQDFPLELDLCAIVTQGLSIRNSLHRVLSHAFKDTVTAFNRLYELGYRRLGLVLGQYEELRGGHAHSAAYLGWCEQNLNQSQTLPILRMDKVEPEPLLNWLRLHRPDALVFVHVHSVLNELHDIFQRNGVLVPEEIGVAVISPFLEGSGFDGLQENQSLIGRWSVDLLASCIANRDYGIPAAPHVEMVESHWIRGNSLRRLRS